MTKYGLKAFHPLAKNFPYSHYDDFGVSRSYGYRRQHLGHDMMGQTGTPVVAVESGYVEAIGWNQYGGWRLGIRSFDKKRYYYYAPGSYTHLDAFVRFDCCSRRSYRLIPFINVYISQIRIIGPAKRIRSAKIPPITVITVTMKKTTITRRSSFQYHLFRLK